MRSALLLLALVAAVAVQAVGSDMDHGLSLEAAFDHFDSNGDGVIDFAEFQRESMADNPQVDSSEVYQKFVRADVDQNGQLTKAEFREIYRGFQELWAKAASAAGVEAEAAGVDTAQLLLLRAKVAAGKDTRSTRSFLRDVLDRLYWEEEEDLATHARETQALDEEVGRLGKQGGELEEAAGMAKAVLDTLRKSAIELKEKILANEDRMRRFQAANTAALDPPARAASLLELGAQAQSSASIAASSERASSKLGAVVARLGQTSKLGVSRVQAQTQSMVDMLGGLDSLPTIRGKLRRLSEARAVASKDGWDPLLLRFLESAERVVKRAEPGSRADGGALIPASEIRPILQGLLDDILVFQSLLDQHAQPGGDLEELPASLGGAVGVGVGVSVEGDASLFNHQIAQVAAETRALRDAYRRRVELVRQQERDLAELQDAIDTKAKQAKALRDLRQRLTRVVAADALRRKEEWDHVSRLLSDSFPRPPSPARADSAPAPPAAAADAPRELSGEGDGFGFGIGFGGEPGEYQGELTQLGLGLGLDDEVAEADAEAAGKGSAEAEAVELTAEEEAIEMEAKARQWGKWMSALADLKLDRGQDKPEAGVDASAEAEAADEAVDQGQEAPPAPLAAALPEEAPSPVPAAPTPAADAAAEPGEDEEPLTHPSFPPAPLAANADTDADAAMESFYPEPEPASHAKLVLEGQQAALPQPGHPGVDMARFRARKAFHLRGKQPGPVPAPAPARSTLPKDQASIALAAARRRVLGRA